MNRLWLGIGILLLILAVGIFATKGIRNIHTDIAQTLEAAAQEENYEKAAALAESAGVKWKKYRNLCAASMDHRPLGEIDEAFAAMEIYSRQGDTTEFYAACARLAVSTRSLGDAYVLTWWNLL